ncbi:MAG: hypothetical protein QHH14_11680 [Clostridiales bacterium]|nr:hypothetical protein [Clostridiales bacterium]
MMKKSGLPNLREPDGSCLGSPPPFLAVDLADIDVRESTPLNAPGGVSSRGAKRRGDLRLSDNIKKLIAAALVIAAVILWAALLGGQSAEAMVPALGANQTADQQEEPKVQAEAQPEKIVAGPQNIKEKTATYVFLGWMWISIGVLVYVLRLKIKEVDRLHAIKFFSPDRK